VTYSRFIINVVQIGQWVLGIYAYQSVTRVTRVVNEITVDNKRATETVEVLHTQLTVIPVCPSLVAQRHLVRVGGIRSNGTVGYEWGTLVVQVLAVEEDAIKVQGGTETHRRVGLIERVSYDIYIDKNRLFTSLLLAVTNKVCPFVAKIGGPG